MWLGLGFSCVGVWGVDMRVCEYKSMGVWLCGVRVSKCGGMGADMGEKRRCKVDRYVGAWVHGCMGVFWGNGCEWVWVGVWVCGCPGAWVCVGV